MGRGEEKDEGGRMKDEAEKVNLRSVESKIFFYETNWAYCLIITEVVNVQEPQESGHSWPKLEAVLSPKC